MVRVLSEGSLSSIEYSTKGWMILSIDHCRLATSKIIMTDNKDDNNYKMLTALLEFSELDEFQFSLMEPFCRLYGPNRSKADYRYMEY